MEAAQTCPLPESSTLAAIAVGLNKSGHAAEIVDKDWRWLYSTDELRLSMSGMSGLAPIAQGAHYFGPESIKTRLEWRAGPNTSEFMRDFFAALGNLMVTDTPIDRLRDQIDPSLRDLVETLSPVDPDSSDTSFELPTTMFGNVLGGVAGATIRVRDISGQVAGTAIIYKPPVGMSTLMSMAASGDPQHFERMRHVVTADRCPAAILFADLEASSALARRLSTARYFALGRRLVRAADQCVIDAGGIVGRHVGDGVAAFFLADTAGSETAAARGCITAARTLKIAAGEVATRSGLEPEDVVLRFGLHWASTSYVGLIITSGRTEVTALGDEVNEAARIEACATGGLALASKALIERLDAHDAAALDLDAGDFAYSTLADLTTATEKARRDAPAIAVCRV